MLCQWPLMRGALLASYNRGCKDRLSKYLVENIEHCMVTSLRVIQTDRKVHLSIGIDSDDAAGQNMVT